MPSSDNDRREVNPGRADDPYLQVMVGIAAELQAIRQTLQTAVAGIEADAADDPDEYVCQCGKTVYDTGEARRHAVDDHNAPPNYWRECYP